MNFSYIPGHESEIAGYLGEHVEITLITLVFALLIAVPIGTIVARVPLLYTPVMAILGAIYTIPSLALLAVLIPYFGFGLVPATAALVAYAQFILVRNVVVGIREVDPAIVDAARGMGMGSWRILFQIEYPLALPVILAGLRIATVATIAIATIAAIDDVPDLGRMLFDGVNENNSSEIFVGVVVVSLLAIIADIILRIVNRQLPATRARAGI
ncbi:MAG TPA: ABC transporter permease [Chloroflexota bacterium]|nr:ABC transporter permease [Chloroflexota bacterium]